MSRGDKFFLAGAAVTLLVCCVICASQRDVAREERDAARDSLRVSQAVGFDRVTHALAIYQAAAEMRAEARALLEQNRVVQFETTKLLRNVEREQHRWASDLTVGTLELRRPAAPQGLHVHGNPDPAGDVPVPGTEIP